MKIYVVLKGHKDTESTIEFCECLMTGLFDVFASLADEDLEAYRHSRILSLDTKTREAEFVYQTRDGMVTRGVFLPSVIIEKILWWARKRIENLDV